MFALPNIDEDLDLPEPPEKDDNIHAGRVLAEMALEAALTRKTRAQLKRHPSVIVVAVPNADWVPLMAETIRRMENAPAVYAYSEPLKGRAQERLGKDELRWLQSGRSVLYLSQDPGGLLHEAVLAGADANVVVPALTPALLRQVIRKLTGGVARGVTEAMAGLGLDLLVSLLRPGASAAECVANLRRAVERAGAAGAGKAPSGPLLEDLPLTKNVRDWAELSAADLKAAIAGTLNADQLVYGVLEGPTGTGKSLIAESLARSTGSSFVFSSVGEWFTTGDGALGGVARNLRLFIDTMLSKAPSVGLLDEIESVPNRATVDNRGRDWWTPIVTLFLTEIDRLRKSGKPVLLLGATNYYNLLDTALVRPGRLHQRVNVAAPASEAEMLALLRYYLGGDLGEADIEGLLPLVQSATPAEIEGWVKQARRAARAEKRALNATDFVAQVVPADERSLADIRAVAIHEIGHAVVAHRLGLKVDTVSIIPAGLSGGHTRAKLATQVPTWSDVTNLVMLALGGRAADMVVGAGANAGAEGDLAEATRLLCAAYETQGLRDDLVSRQVLGPALGRDTLHRTIDAELKRLLGLAMDIVVAERDLVLALAERLMAEKVLTGAQLASALEGNVEPGQPTEQDSTRTAAPERPSSLMLKKGRGPAGEGLPLAHLRTMEDDRERVA